MTKQQILKKRAGQEAERRLKNLRDVLARELEITELSGVEKRSPWALFRARILLAFFQVIFPFGDRGVKPRKIPSELRRAKRDVQKKRRRVGGGSSLTERAEVELVAPDAKVPDAKVPDAKAPEGSVPSRKGKDRRKQVGGVAF